MTVQHRVASVPGEVSTNLVDIRPGSGPSAVNRINRQRQVTVTCNVAPGGSQAAIITALQRGVRGTSHGRGLS